MLPLPPVMLITDTAQTVLPLEDILQQCLTAGCRWIMLRDVTADDETLTTQATRIKQQCVSFNAKLFISRNIRVAKAVQADGLHLSASQSISDARQDCPHMIIGKSCHSIKDIINAEKHGADVATLSPIFETSSKPGYGPALGLQALEKACACVSIPVLALGGIDAKQAGACKQAGAYGIAVMGNIMRSNAPTQTMQELLRSISGGLMNI